MSAPDYDIMTDSPANLPDEYLKQWGLKVLSLEFIVDNVSYKGYDPDQPTNNKQFYDMMRDGKVVMTTLASINDAEALLRESFDRGQDVLYIAFDSSLSANFEFMSSYMEKIRVEHYPMRRLRCVDTLTAALGEGLLVLEAAKRRSQGMPLDELADWVEQNKLLVNGWFTVDDLKYLQRGGRLSAGAAFAGMLLSIKPILNFNDQGQLIPREKIRGRRRALQYLADRVQELIRQPAAGEPVYISHADCQEDCDYLIQLILAQLPDVQILTNNLDPVIGAHAGPGTVAVFFFGSQSR